MLKLVKTYADKEDQERKNDNGDKSEADVTSNFGER